jgi:hypothetical protein
MRLRSMIIAVMTGAYIYIVLTHTNRYSVCLLCALV